MVEDTLNKNGLLGMIQSKEINGDVFHVGCLGKIIKHERTSDGRILINLKGLTRFKIDQEVKNDKPYREFLVNYDVFKDDMHPKNNTIENDNLSNLINYSKKYFDQIGIQINWSELSKLSISQQIYTLAMISPFSNGEKQKLLEIVKLEDMVNTLKTITKFTFYEETQAKILRFSNFIYKFYPLIQSIIFLTTK